MALNIKTLGVRALSSVFFVIILVSCIWYNYLSFLLLFFAVGLLALYEYYRLAEKLNARPPFVVFTTRLMATTFSFSSRSPPFTRVICGIHSVIQSVRRPAFLDCWEL